jgi:multidrug efflux system outer membrane protein
MRTPHHGLALLMITVLLGGCAAFRMDRPVEGTRIDVPAAWLESGKGNNGRISTGWLDEFSDARMKQLVRSAIRNNQDLKAAAYRLRATREGTIGARAARLPSLETRAGYSRTYDGLGPLPGVDRESYSLSFNASWEIDLWGRLRDLDEASYANYEAAVADFRGARLSLAVNAAKAWANLIAAEQQLELAHTTLASYKDNLRIMERRYRANLLRSVDVQFGRNNVAAAERNVSSQTLNRNDAARSLEILTSQYPSASLQGSRVLPKLKKDVPAGLPSELISRRPDLIASRSNVYASAKIADAARKDLLPSIRLVGSAANNSDSFSRVTDPDYLTWSAASSLAQTIYRGGAPSAAARAALERNRASIHTYVQDCLGAFREVESALEAERSLAQQEHFLRQEVQQAGLAEKQSERDMAMGIEGSTVLEILEAQRRAVNARISLIRLRNERLQNRLDLHLALGGDFETSK